MFAPVSYTHLYDTTLGALFVRVSDIMNDLIGKAKVSGEANGNIDYSCFSLKNLTKMCIRDRLYTVASRIRHPRWVRGR